MSAWNSSHESDWSSRLSTSPKPLPQSAHSPIPPLSPLKRPVDYSRSTRRWSPDRIADGEGYVLSSCWPWCCTKERTCSWRTWTVNRFVGLPWCAMGGQWESLRICQLPQRRAANWNSVHRSWCSFDSISFPPFPLPSPFLTASVSIQYYVLVDIRLQRETWRFQLQRSSPHPHSNSFSEPCVFCHFPLSLWKYFNAAVLGGLSVMILVAAIFVSCD